MVHYAEELMHNKSEFLCKTSIRGRVQTRKVVAYLSLPQLLSFLCAGNFGTKLLHCVLSNDILKVSISTFS